MFAARGFMKTSKEKAYAENEEKQAKVKEVDMGSPPAVTKKDSTASLPRSSARRSPSKAGSPEPRSKLTNGE